MLEIFCSTPTLGRIFEDLFISKEFRDESVEAEKAAAAAAAAAAAGDKVGLRIL
jgi:hypothetical protein